MYLSDLASHRASLSLSDFLFSLFYLAFTSLKTTDFVRSTIKNVFTRRRSNVELKANNDLMFIYYVAIMN